ncbi:peptide chain release factor-like protein, partial [Lentibacter algarum]
MPLTISDEIEIADWEISEVFVRSSGPGGQNVNKVSTAVELRFEAERSPNLPAPVKTRLRKLAG